MLKQAGLEQYTEQDIIDELVKHDVQSSYAFNCLRLLCLQQLLLLSAL